MARLIGNRDISAVLAAAERWISDCLVGDGSVFSAKPRWTPELVDEVFEAFVNHPDVGEDDFMTKLKGQMKNAAPSAQQLTAEMLWILLLFPSNMKAVTKRQQIREIWALSGQELREDSPFLSEEVLAGVGSGGPGFNNYRPDELAFLISLTRGLKTKVEQQRGRILGDYDEFMSWIDSVPRRGSRQFRHMLRYFAFPDRVERISSNGDRRKILEAFGVASARDIAAWRDRQLDDGLAALRVKLQAIHPSVTLDFYNPPLKDQWSRDRKVRSVVGEVSVTVPGRDDDMENEGIGAPEKRPQDARQSIQVQSRLAKIGETMGFKIWVPRGDKARILELMRPGEHPAFLDNLPLNYDSATLDTIEQIDVLWLKGRSIVRAFEVEHTTAVYSGLLRMADLLALQPNMDIRLHIVAPDERREKVFREMTRPVFSLLDRGPLSDCCTFISYESINAISELRHLARMNDGIIADYEERPESS